MSNHQTKRYLVIDIGGTNIKCAQFDDEYSIIEKHKYVTPAVKSEFIELIHQIIQEHEPVLGLAFSLPGKVDTVKKTVYFGGALPYLHEMNFEKEFGHPYHLPVVIQNDAKSATFAELKLGHLQGIRDGAAIILGTGVGGGVILDGRLRSGGHFQAGEFSLSIIESKEEGLGKLAGFACSAVEFIKEVNQATDWKEPLDGPHAFEMIQDGDERALPLFEDYCRSVAYLIINIQMFFDIEKCVIGGGISSQSILIDQIIKEYTVFINSHPLLKMNIPMIDIAGAKFHNDANLYGVYYQLLEALS